MLWKAPAVLPVAAAKALCGVSGLTPLNACRLLPGALSLLAVMRGARRALPGLRVPLTIINSRSDEIVAARQDALQWALMRGSRSGRVAWQFARDHAGRLEDDKA